MTTVMPQGELLRKAIQWYSDERKAHPEKSIAELVEGACVRYNLSPKDAEALRRFTREGDA
ncbi:MAG: hypothetical protein ACOWWM_06360 [Desulfobacterales bacterium]